MGHAVPGGAGKERHSRRIRQVTTRLGSGIGDVISLLWGLSNHRSRFTGEHHKATTLPLDRYMRYIQYIVQICLFMPTITGLMS